MRLNMAPARVSKCDPTQYPYPQRAPGARPISPNYGENSDLSAKCSKPIERTFWRLAQRKGQLEDRLTNEGVALRSRTGAGTQRTPRRQEGR